MDEKRVLVHSFTLGSDDPSSVKNMYYTSNTASSTQGIEPGREFLILTKFLNNDVSTDLYMKGDNGHIWRLEKKPVVTISNEPFDHTSFDILLNNPMTLVSSDGINWGPQDAKGKKKKTQKKTQQKTTSPYKKTNRTHIGKDGVKRCVYTKDGKHYVAKYAIVKGERKLRHVQI